MHSSNRSSVFSTKGTDGCLLYWGFLCIFPHFGVVQHIAQEKSNQCCTRQAGQLKTLQLVLKMDRINIKPVLLLTTTIKKTLKYLK